jgi:hypothetical protein
MFAKKEPPASPALPEYRKQYRKELEYLYARRSAIDTLIDSLEDYNRFRAVRPDAGEQQTA